MKTIALAAILCLLAAPALAADPAPPAKPTSTAVTLDATDLQVAIIAIANAGAACDAQVLAYCQLPQARAAVMAKLQGAFQALQAPAPAGK